jgi:hypothetical protein
MGHSKNIFMEERELVSNCCGATPRGNGDCDTSDFGICPACGEHCDYIYLDDEEMKMEILTGKKETNES